MTIRALVRRPSAEIADCLLTFQQRRPIDFDLLARQHRAYVGALEEVGVRVTTLPALAGHPDAVFVEDAAVVLDEVSILCRSGAPSRRAEAGALAPHLPRDRPVRELPESLLLDGGDVLRVGRTLLVGRSTRSSPEAPAALRDLLGDHGYRVVGVGVQGALHLKTAVTAATGADFVVLPGSVDVDEVRRALGGPVRFHTVSPAEAAGANVLRLPATAGAAAAAGVVLVPASAPELGARLEALGLTVVGVDLSEFEKAEAGATCLSVVYTDGITSRAG
jgi:dimethylargininase